MALHDQPLRGRWRCAVRVTAALLTFAAPATVQAQSAPPPDSDAPLGQTVRTDAYPVLSTRREIAVTALGAGLLITGHLVHVTVPNVPAAGLDPSEISWGADRSEVGNRSTRANDLSNWTRDAALAFPLALAFASAAPGEPWHGLRDRGVVYAETLLFSQGSTLLAKGIWTRPRPFTYLPVSERPNDPAYDVTQTRAFRSIPSGHASSAWTGVSLGITEELLSRPEASWVERVGVGFVGGGLGAATSTLRVGAGQHFRSDVLAGAGIGIATGVAVPLLHRGGRPLPSSKAVLETLGGTVAGTLVGILVAR